MAHHGTYTQHGCRWLTIGLTHNTDADGSPLDSHITRMPMARHRTYTHRCQWLPIGLTHNTDNDGSPRDLYTTWMPMAHHRAYTLHKTYTQHGCQWLTIGLPATVMKHNSEPGGSPWDLYATKYADGLPWDLNATKYVDDSDADRLHSIAAVTHTFTRDGKMTSRWASCPYQVHSRRSTGGSSVLPATLSGSSRLSDNSTSLPWIHHHTQGPRPLGHLIS